MSNIYLRVLWGDRPIRDLRFRRERDFRFLWDFGFRCLRVRRFLCDFRFL